MLQMRVVEGAPPRNGCPPRRWRAAPARPEGSAGRGSVGDESPALDGHLAPRIVVRKGQEDSLQRGDTSRSKVRVQATEHDHPV